MITDDLRRAYNATAFHVFAHAQIILRPGELCPAADELLLGFGATSGVVLTAWNPMSEPTDDVTNDAAQTILAAEITALGLTALSAEGRGIDTAWPPEPSFFIPGITAQATQDLAARFRQAAWVHVGVGEPVRIVETDFGAANA